LNEIVRSKQLKPTPPYQVQATPQRTGLVNQIKRGIVLKPACKPHFASLSAIQRHIRIKQAKPRRAGLFHDIKQGIVLKPTPHQRISSTISSVRTSKGHKAVLNSIKQHCLLNTATESCCVKPFPREMQLLKEMGFGNIDTNWLQSALVSSSGDVNAIVGQIIDNALRFKHITRRRTVLKEIQSHGGFCATNSTNVASKVSWQPSPTQVQAQRALSVELVAYVSMKHRVRAIESRAHADIQDAIILFKRAMCN
jgi:hypothetical protein